MAKSLQMGLGPMGLTTVDPHKADRSTTVDQVAVDLAWLNVAVSDCGYTLDALEASMRKGRAYIHKVLQGEKPLSQRFIVALPRDVRARYAALQAEDLGYIVVAPVSGDQAVRNLVSGLLGVLKRPA